MTDTTAGGRGGVGFRLYTSGGEVVKRTFDQVGASGKKMWSEIALGERTANPAFRAINRASSEARDGVQGLADRTGAFGRSLGAFGAAGVAFAAVVGGMAIAVTQAREAMAFADEIDDSANKLQISTDALQEYRYALVVAGAEAKDFDTAVASFTKTLGAAQSGLSPKAMKPFAALGFTKEDLNSFENGEQALEEVAQRIALLSKESERAAVAEKLGLAPMLPLLRRGADEMERLRIKAQELGLVMDEELVKTGADATEQMDTLAMVIKVQMSEAFVGLSEEIVGFTSHIADALRGLNNFIDKFNEWKGQAQRSGDYPNEFEQTAMKFGGAGWMTAWISNRSRAARRFFTGQQPLPELRRPEEKSFNLSEGDTLEDTSTRRPARPDRSGAAAAAKELRDRERARDQLERDGLRAERDVVRLRHSGSTADERLRLAQETARLEREERDAQRVALEAELTRTNAMSDATRAALAHLKSLDAEADTLADRAMIEEHRKQLAADALRRDRATADEAMGLLDIEAQLVQTRQEQYRIERQILRIRQSTERKALVAELEADKSLSEGDREGRLSLRDRRDKLELDLFDETERERQRATFKSFGYDFADAIKEKRIGAWFADEMQNRLLDMALNGLFDMIFPRDGGGAAGSGGSSSGNWIAMAANIIGSFFGGQGAGRAGGGGLMSGMRHPMVETGRPELLMVGGTGHVSSSAETARMLKDMMADTAGGGRTVIEQHHHWDLRHAVTTEQLLRQMDVKAGQAEQRAIRTSIDANRRGAPGLQQRMRRTGTV